jgi:hypothetical protein
VSACISELLDGDQPEGDPQKRGRANSGKGG